MFSREHHGLLMSNLVKTIRSISAEIETSIIFSFHQAPVICFVSLFLSRAMMLPNKHYNETNQRKDDQGSGLQSLIIS